MTDLIAVHYPDLATACDAMQTLERLEAAQVVELDDAVLVERRYNGEVKLHHSHRPTVTGAAGGALWGALIGLIFLQPLLGMAGGPAGMVGDAMSEIGVDHALVRRLGERLPTDGAAVFVLARRPSSDEVMRSLARLGGRILHTSLSDRAQARLRAALEPHAIAA
jgi:uncharacterized membrane protein